MDLDPLVSWGYINAPSRERERIVEKEDNSGVVAIVVEWWGLVSPTGWRVMSVGRRENVRGIHVTRSRSCYVHRVKNVSVHVTFRMSR